MDMSNVLVLMISFGMDSIYHVRKQKMTPHVLRKAIEGSFLK